MRNTLLYPTGYSLADACLDKGIRAYSAKRCCNFELLLFCTIEQMFWGAVEER